MFRICFRYLKYTHYKPLIRWRRGRSLTVIIMNLFKTQNTFTNIGYICVWITKVLHASFLKPDIVNGTKIIITIDLWHWQHEMKHHAKIHSLMVSYFYLTFVYIRTIVIYFSASFHVFNFFINVLYQRISLGLEVACHTGFVALSVDGDKSASVLHISNLLNVWLNWFIKTTEALTYESEIINLLKLILFTNIDSLLNETPLIIISL